MIIGSIAPPNASFFASLDVMQFYNGVNVIDSFCLPEGQSFEFFLNLDTISLNGNDVKAIGLSTSPYIRDSIVIDEKHNTWLGDDYNFHLYFKGKISEEMTQLYIVYRARARRYLKPISAENGFTWGYSLLPTSVKESRVRKPTACCEFGELCDLPQHKISFW